VIKSGTYPTLVETGYDSRLISGGVPSMRKTALVGAILLLATAAAAQTGAGWKTLFNGKDLSNWSVTGNADWKVTDGVIEATKARGFLLTKESYTDFEFRADVWTTPDSNGGLLFRITKPDDPGDLKRD
jgi:hypothetical protein